MHMDQYSTIQMDGLEDDTIAADDTHQFDQSFSSCGCRPRGWRASAPPGQSCAVRQRSRLWQWRGAAMQSTPCRPIECTLLRRDSIGMILYFTYIKRVYFFLRYGRVAHT